MDDTAASPKRDMVGKALLILERLGDYPHGVTLSLLSGETGFPLSTCHRLATALVRDGFASFDEESRRYSVGLKVFSLAQQVAHRRGFAASARPVLQELSERTREASLMAVRDDDHQLYVQYVEGPQQVSVIGTPGARGPLHCTSMGKTLVAFAPEPERERLVAELPLPALGPNTVTDRSAFAAMIEQVRELGYALADEEHEQGIRAVGVPVLDAEGHAFASISTAAPAFRAGVDDLVAVVPSLREAASRLALVLPTRGAAPMRHR